MSSSLRSGVARISDGPQAVLIGLVRVYQIIISPLVGPRCRYYPSCSAYAVLALRRWGAIRGGGLVIWRLVRCNPWSLGGVDHVPGTDGAAVRRTSGEMVHVRWPRAMRTEQGSR